MTSPSDVQRELEEVSESVLENLSADERATLAVELAAAGEIDKAETVKDAAPVHTYRARDLDFTHQVMDNIMMALYATWELETGVWKFFYQKADGALQKANYERYPDEDWTSEPSPENGHHEQAAKDAAAEFLGNYLAWSRYADEEVGVDLETFLAHPFGGDAKVAIETIGLVAQLAHGGLREGEDPPGWADGGTVTVDGQELTVEEHADQKYAQLTEADL